MNPQNPIPAPEDRDHLIQISVDPEGHDVLKKMMETANLPSLPATIFASLRIMRTLQMQSLEGFTEVLVQDPVTLQKMQVEILRLSPEKGSSNNSDFSEQRGELVGTNE